LNVAIDVGGSFQVTYFSVPMNNAKLCVKFARTFDCLCQFLFASLAIVDMQTVGPHGIGLFFRRSGAAVDREHLLVPSKRICLDIKIPEAETSDFRGNLEALIRLSQLDLTALSFGHIGERQKRD
jgi:hypothetical protein